MFRRTDIGAHSGWRRWRGFALLAAGLWTVSALGQTADLGITVDDGVTEAVAGTQVTYTVTVTNAGPSDVTGATVATMFPPDFLNVSWTCEASGGAACTAGPVGGVINEMVDIPSGGMVVFTVNATLSPAASGTVMVGAGVTAPDGITDDDSGNNTDTDTNTVLVRSDLAVSKGNGQSQVTPGQLVTYTVTVMNNGPSDAVGALVTDVMPMELQNVSWTCASSGGASCGDESGTGDIDETVDVPAGAMVVYTITGLVDDTLTSGTLSNTAEVAAGPDGTDPNLSNNSRTDADAIMVNPIVNLRPSFFNMLPSTNAFAMMGAMPPPNGASAFGGHVGDTSAPVEARFTLKASSFGQPVARFSASPTHTSDTVERAQNDLFYIPGRPAAENNQAAFRYINSFFGQGGGSGLDTVRMRLDDAIPFDARITDNGIEDTDEERALRVANEVIDALRFEPFNSDLRNLLLDIYYYRTLGRQIAAKDQTVQAYQLNFSTVISDTEPFGGPINKEIQAFETASNALTGVLDPYRELFFDNMGIDISLFDRSATGNMPFGYRLFVEEVPRRSIYAATFAQLDQNMELSGNTTPVVPSDPPGQAALIVGPTGFQVDSEGRPAGSSSSSITFTVRNVGASELSWRATMENPVDNFGASVDMLSFPGSAAPTVSATTSMGTLAPGAMTTLTVNVASNVSPNLRVGTVRVEDTGSAGSAGLVYRVVVVQERFEGPVIRVSQNPVEFRAAGGITERQIFVFNGGTGHLNWRATLQGAEVSNTLFDVRWLRIRGENELSFGTEATGVNNGALHLLFSPPRNLANAEEASILVEDMDEVASPVTITVQIEELVGQTSKSLALTKQTGSPLLALVPGEILAGREAVTRNFVVREGGRFAWTAAVTSGASWLSIESSNPATGAVELSIDENTEAQGRVGVVTVTSAETTPSSAQLMVRQDGTSTTGLNVSPVTQTVGAGGGMSLPEPAGTGFVVSRAGTGNIAWTARVTKGAEWLSIISGTSGTNEGEIQFAFDPNPREFGRTAEILVESSDAVGLHNSVLVQVEQVSGSGAAVLTSGFKDLALLFDVLKDEAQVKKELARRYGLRRLSGDVGTANRLIEETVIRHTAAICDVSGIIPNWRNQVAPSSDLIATFQGWQQAVEELNTTKDFINGGTNVLGFQEDFLFLVQTFPGQPPDLFDSFDKLIRYMFDGNNNTAVLTSPLGIAFDKFMTARAEFDTFVMTQDQLREELRTQNLEHRSWMFNNIGVDPGNDPDNPNDAAAYANPQDNYGSEIWIQTRSIERAIEGIRKNLAEQQNILNQINTELWRRAQEQAINATIADIHIQYGDMIAQVEQAIGYINGAQKLADNIADAFNVAEAVLSSGAQTAARITNGVLQAAAEVAKGFLEGDKAQLAAAENSAVRQLEDQILQVNSEALIQNLYGQYALVATASTELNIQLTQELGARQALIDEWRFREGLMRENNMALAGRAFANPVHRLRMRRAMLEAEQTFKVAQRWVFFAIRALEYKWNTPFTFTNDVDSWSQDSLFRSRTAKDLIDLVAALRDYDALLQGSSRGDDRFDWFSFKQDFMGLEPVFDGDGNEIRAYAHPLTGFAATATDVFRAKLEMAVDPDTGILELPFSTFLDNDETFFRGPRRSPSNPSNVISRGQYLDKIVWLKINLLGDFTVVDRGRVPGTLTYSGGSYIRNERVGRIPDPARPDRIVDEFERWSTKFWFFDSGIPQVDPPVPAAWRSSDEQTTEVALNLTETPRTEIPDSVSQINVFSERSVACDGWVLRIFTRGANGAVRLDLDELDDIEILFYHVSKDRPAFPPLQ